MWKIVICDDNEEFLHYIKDMLYAYLSERNIKCEICTYKDSRYIIGLDFSTTHIYLLDIDMPQLDGFSIASVVRNKTPDSLIIFISNREERVYESLKYRPIRFIRKGHVTEELAEALDVSFRELEQRRKLVTLPTTDGVKMIALASILYVESNAHYVFFHSLKDVYKVRGMLSHYAKNWEPHEFAQSAKSYLVNCRYITRIDANGAALADGTVIPVSRKYKKNLEHYYMEYLRRKVHGTFV